jgi:hypothetical protein
LLCLLIWLRPSLFVQSFTLATMLVNKVRFFVVAQSLGAGLGFQRICVYNWRVWTGEKLLVA